MKIATWNLERLKHKSELNSINKKLEDINADILVLTETDNQINCKNYKYKIETPKLSEISSDYYRKTENRVTVLTNYEIVKQYDTYDKYTSLCIELKTEIGNLKVYGTIIGIYGNRNANFNQDLAKQLIDIDRLSTDKNLCVVGDYNISFSDNYYFTNFGRNEIEKSFEKNGIELLTRNQKECIDHIAISRNFIENKGFEAQEWNENKKLSDHKGISINIIR